MRETMLEALAQAGPTDAALVELGPLKDTRVGKPIDQQRDFEIVQNLHARHVDLVLQRVAEIERNEVQVIVNRTRVAVEFGVAANLKVLAGVEQGPGGRRKADRAYIKIRHPRAIGPKNGIDPGKRALMSNGIDAFELALHHLGRNAIHFEDDHAPNLRQRRTTGPTQPDERGKPDNQARAH